MTEDTNLFGEPLPRLGAPLFKERCSILSCKIKAERGTKCEHAKGGNPRRVLTNLTCLEVKMAKAIRICAAPGCDNVYYSLGYCIKHYYRFKKYGDPMDGATFHGETHAFLENVALPFVGDECLTWPYGRSSGGYGAIKIEGAQCIVSRVICERTHGPAPSGDHEAAHNCGKGHLGCVNPGHIVWKTSLANQKDRLIHGTDHRGEKHISARLTEADVRDIRRLRRLGVKRRDLARKYGLKPNYVGEIAAGRAWRWLPDE